MQARLEQEKITRHSGVRGGVLYRSVLFRSVTCSCVHEVTGAWRLRFERSKAAIYS